MFSNSSNCLWLPLLGYLEVINLITHGTFRSPSATQIATKNRLTKCQVAVEREK